MQLVAFRKRRMVSPLGMHATLLCFIPLEYTNQCGFPACFTAANLSVTGISGLTLQQLHRAREELAEGGYIGYTKSSENRCGIYTVRDLYKTYEAQDDMQSDIQNDMQSDMQSDIKSDIKRGMQMIPE